MLEDRLTPALAIQAAAAGQLVAETTTAQFSFLRAGDTDTYTALIGATLVGTGEIEAALAAAQADGITHVVIDSAASLDVIWTAPLANLDYDGLGGQSLTLDANGSLSYAASIDDSISGTDDHLEVNFIASTNVTFGVGTQNALFFVNGFDEDSSLSVSAGGNITQTVATSIEVFGEATIQGDDVLLDQANNSFGADVTIDATSGNILLSALTIDGSLEVSASGDVVFTVNGTNVSGDVLAIAGGDLGISGALSTVPH